MDEEMNEEVVDETNNPVNESILGSIKKLIGIVEEDTTFDQDLVLHINSVLSILTQLGVGSVKGLSITGADEKWTDFVDREDSRLEMIKTYVYLRVSLLFDPPTNSFLVDAKSKTISELEWRITVANDFNTIMDSEDKS